MCSLGPVVAVLTLAVWWPGCAARPAEGPLSPRDLEVFRNNTTWRPPQDVTLVDAPPPTAARQGLWAVSVNVGDIKVIEGDSSNVSPVNNAQGSGWGLRMDEGRQDLARLTAQVLAEAGDRFDFVAVFPAFQDLLNPGFAYFSLVKNMDEGIGLNRVDLARQFGSDGRLQGFINMNRPSAYTAVDGRSIADPQSAAFPIMGQEMTHRWAAYARFQRPDVNGGLPTALLLGRDNSHWSALMHTGPLDPGGNDSSCSVQDGVSWVDHGNSTFTAVDVFADPQFNISPRARFSALDLYFMGMVSKAEVDPFFIITNGRLGSQLVPSSGRLPRGITITGNRMDITMDHIVDAMGPRVPGSAEAQHDFSMAVVVLTAPGQPADEVMAMVAEVDAFRVQWEERFHAWTRQRGSLCTSLSGVCQQAPLALEDVAWQEDDEDGVWTPGERLTVRAWVHNPGVMPSDLAAVNLLAHGAATVAPTTQLVGSVPPGQRVPVTMVVTPLPGFTCGQNLRVVLTLTASGSPVQTAVLDRTVGVREVARYTMEDIAGFVVDPDGTDTATAGEWRAGVPRPTNLGALGYPSVVFQPAGDGPDEGTRAFFSDPGDDGLDPSGWDDTDVDDGVTTLQLPPLPLANVRAPQLSWQVWHASAVVDLINARVDPATGDDLVVLARVDDGPYVELDRVAGHAPAWEPRQVALWDVPGLGARNGVTLHVRVVAQDVGDQNVVEAGVDAFALTSAVDTCQLPATSSSSAAVSANASSAGPSGSSTASASTGGSSGTPLLPRPVGPSRCAEGLPQGAPWFAGLVWLVWWRRRAWPLWAAGR